MRKFIFLIIIVMMTLPWGCGEKIRPGTSKVERLHVSGITTETISPSDVDEYYETSGTIRAKTISIIASRVMGTVTSLRVKEGDRVESGEVLLTLDDSDMVQKLKGAQDAYREARKGVEAADENRKLQEITYRRYKKLYEEKALTGQEFDQLKTQKRVAEIEYERAKAALSRAEAGVNEAKVYHGFTRLTSPVKGIVTEKKIEVGSMAVPGVPLATVEDNSSYRIEIGADEKLAGRIKIGMAALISVDSLNSDVTGRVTDVVPSVDPMSRSFLVKIGLKTEGLRNGLYGRVSIPVGRKEALLVPRESLVERGQLTGVYVVGKDEVITYRLIKTGRSYGGKIEVLAGLSSGERVIVKGVESAVDGGLAAATAK